MNTLSVEVHANIIDLSKVSGLPIYARIGFCSGEAVVRGLLTVAGIDRRGFIRSIFGLTGALEVAGAASAKSSASIFWSDLKSGQIGFPTGLHVPQERPGSLMKLVAAAALLDGGLINTSVTHECTGTYRIGHEDVHCQKAHGRLDIVHALGLSCNIFFAQASKHLTVSAFLDKARALGLATECGGRDSGAFPHNPEHASLHYVLGLAPDLMPNALQLLRLAALVGIKPGGKLPVLHSAENFDLVEKESAITSPLSERSHKVIVEGMRLCVTAGTARKLDPENKLHIAAKTGTITHGNKFQSYVIGFFPFDAPRHAFVLQAQAGTSQDSAVPRAHDFLYSTEWP